MNRTLQTEGHGPSGPVHIILRIALLVLFAVPSLLYAQVTWSGIYDFEIKKGGKDSKPAVNKVNNEFLQLNVRSLQFFVSAPVAEDVVFSAKISTDSRGGSDATDVRLELANITFLDIFDGMLNISAGKILTPFGAFTRRQLSTDNPLIGVPLFFYYVTNVSPQSGYLDSSGVLLSDALYGGRLSTIYYGGYYTGVEVFGSIAGDFVSYDFAVMNAPLSFPNSAINLDKNLAVHGRVALRPVIWGELGASYSAGSFLQAGNVNSIFDSMGGIGKFTQQTIGLDLTLGYLYYEFHVEYIRNRYNAPYIVYDFTVNPPYKQGLSGTDYLELANDELLVDFKVEAPFYPGLYLAGRLDLLTFGTITDPWPASGSFGKEIRWDRNVKRAEVAVGYKPVRNVLIKLGYQWTTVDVQPRPDLNVAAAQISVTF